MLIVGSSRLLSKNFDTGGDFLDMAWIFDSRAR